MFRVVYSSKLDPAVGRAEIDAIVRDARLNNAREGVTGAWVMKDRDCLSALEGPPEAVRALAERIWDDNRHSDFQIRDMRPATQRKFQDSPLDFIDVGEASVETLHDDDSLRWLCGFAGGPAAFCARGLPPSPDGED